MNDYQKINDKKVEVLTNIANKPSVNIRYPAYLDRTMRISLQLKREGHYYAAFEIAYDNLLNLQQNHPDFIMHLYKNIACSGALEFAAYLQVFYVTEYGGRDHFYRLIAGLHNFIAGDASVLIQYLASISGSAYYKIPIPDYELSKEVIKAMKYISFLRL